MLLIYIPFALVSPGLLHLKKKCPNDIIRRQKVAFLDAFCGFPLQLYVNTKNCLPSETAKLSLSANHILPFLTA